MAKKYDSTVDTITGDYLFMFVQDGAEKFPIAFGTTCGVDVSADTIDTSNKMSGSWKEYLTGQLGWTVQCDALYSKKTGHMSFDKLKALMAARQPIPVVLASHTQADEASEYEIAKEFVSGMAVITALSLKADNGAICTSSVTLQGTGALEGADDVTP